MTKNSVQTNVTNTGLEYVKLSDACRKGGIDINKTFDCGQAFRFDPVKDTVHECEFSGVAYGKAVSFAKDGNDLYIYNSTADDFLSLWQHYLGLDTDYEAIRNDIRSRSDNPALGNAIAYGDGIRILSQEPWETVCSFIISQNNNIPRIKKIITAMSARLGRPAGDHTDEKMRGHLSDIMKSGAYTFPTPEAIRSNGIALLAELRTGFRAKYIYDAADKFSSGEISAQMISGAPDTAAAAEILKTIKGVGPKVAACALLFGFERYDAFPIDVWIRRVMEKYFPADYNAASLGSYAGIAQQYLFYYERYHGGE